MYILEIRSSVVSRPREFIEKKGRFCSMELASITPEYVYRMWGETVPLEKKEAGLRVIKGE